MELGARPASGSVPNKNRDLKNGSRVNARPGPVPGLALAKTSHVKVPYSSRPVVSEIHEGLVSRSLYNVRGGNHIKLRRALYLIQEGLTL